MMAVVERAEREVVVDVGVPLERIVSSLYVMRRGGVIEMGSGRGGRLTASRTGCLG